MRFLLTSILFLTISVVFSQDSLIVFDRPGIAESPYITNKANWQFETGFAYADFSGLNEAVLPSIMLRKSFLGANELRITFNYEPQMIALIKRHILLDQDPLAIGIKRKIIKEQKYLPETSILLNTYFPMQELKTIGKTGTYNAELSFQFQNNLNKTFALNYNLGGIVTDQYNKGILTYSVCLNITSNDHLGFFVEGFGFSPNQTGVSESGFDLGCVFNPTPASQVDISFINNIYERTSYGSVLIGYSFILKK